VSPPPTNSEPIAAAPGGELPLSGSGLSEWFQDQVHPHESSLKSYLHGSFPAVRDVDDVVQESYFRLLKARAKAPILSGKAFLFQVARHVALDWLRRGKASPVEAVGNLAALSVMEDRPGVAETISMKEKVQVLAQALVTLPPTCRQVVMLRKLKGLSRKETAVQLGIAEKTVDEHLARGVKKLEHYLRRRGVRGHYET
jgi:RNA polymerase sigma-70 factor (ECF subfamily)